MDDLYHCNDCDHDLRPSWLAQPGEEHEALELETFVRQRFGIKEDRRALHHVLHAQPGHPNVAVVFETAPGLGTSFIVNRNEVWAPV